MERAQTQAILRDLDKKMVLLSGPRQVGKSYLARAMMAGFRSPQVLNYDNAQDRAVIMAESWRSDTDFLILDELHKLPMYLERGKREPGKLLSRWNLVVPERVLNRSWAEVT